MVVNANMIEIMGGWWRSVIFLHNDRSSVYKIYKKELTRNFSCAWLPNTSFLWQAKLYHHFISRKNVEYVLTSISFYLYFCNHLYQLVLQWYLFFSANIWVQYARSLFEDGTMFCPLYLWWMVLHCFVIKLDWDKQVLAFWLGLHGNVGNGGDITHLISVPCFPRTGTKWSAETNDACY